MLSNDIFYLNIYVSTRFRRVCDDFALHNLADLFAFSIPKLWTQTWYQALFSIPNFGPASISHLTKAIHAYAVEHSDILPRLLEEEFYASPPYKTLEAANFARHQAQMLLINSLPVKKGWPNESRTYWWSHFGTAIFRPSWGFSYDWWG